MSPAARLRAQAAWHIEQTARLLREADKLDAAAAPEGARAERTLCTKAAMRLIGVNSTSSMYRLARQFGLGEKTPGGSWRFSELRLRDFASGEFGEAGGEYGDGASCANQSSSPKR